MYAGHSLELVKLQLQLSRAAGKVLGGERELLGGRRGLGIIKAQRRFVDKHLDRGWQCHCMSATTVNTTTAGWGRSETNRQQCDGFVRTGVVSWCCQMNGSNLHNTCERHKQQQLWITVTLQLKAIVRSAVAVAVAMANIMHVS